MFFQPQFTICTHDPSEDEYVSRYILNEGYWESDVAFWLGAIIHRIEAEVLYIDLGANLGIHSIHAAMLGCTVWAVEPQEKNIQKASLYQTKYTQYEIEGTG